MTGGARNTQSERPSIRVVRFEAQFLLGYEGRIVDGAGRVMQQGMPRMVQGILGPVAAVAVVQWEQ